MPPGRNAGQDMRQGRNASWSQCLMAAMPPGRNAARSQCLIAGYRQCLFAPLQARVRPRVRETPIPEFGFARIITTRTRNFSIFKSHYRIAALRVGGIEGWRH